MTDAVDAHAEAVLLAAREELTRADGKASLLLAGVSVGASALLAAALSGDWTPFRLRNSVEWLWWLGALLLLVCITFLGDAIYPRTYRKGEPPSVIAFYGDVVATPPEQLERRLEETVEAGRSATLDQLRQVSGIVDRKYRSIRLALWCSASGVFACTLAVVLDHLLD